MTTTLSAPLKIAVTGAGGFVGCALIRHLTDCGHTVTGWHRERGSFELDIDAEALQAASVQWQQRLLGADVLVHLAARVHHVGENQATAAAHYFRTNTEGTLVLAKAAQAAGVRRLVYFSTAKVYGEGVEEPYRETTQPAPCDAYSTSKWQAEQGLAVLAKQTGLEVVVLRPPLVYGPGVGGNFHALWRLAASGWPLPLAAISNQRDMIAIDNLVDIAARCCVDPRAVEQTFNVADAAPYALPEILRNMRAALGQPQRLWSLPAPLLRALLRIVMMLRGAGDTQRLLGSFLLDTKNVQSTLQWRPVVTMADALRQIRKARVD